MARRRAQFGHDILFAWSGLQRVTNQSNGTVVGSCNAWPRTGGSGDGDVRGHWRDQRDHIAGRPINRTKYRPEYSRPRIASWLPQLLRQLGDVRRDPSRSFDRTFARFRFAVTPSSRPKLNVIGYGSGDVAEASHVSSFPRAQFVSANLVAESTDRGRCPCDGLDIFFRISNRQTG